MYFAILREGEKISAKGFVGLGGEVGGGGRRKCGRWGAEGDDGLGLEARFPAMLARGPGVRGGTILKRCEADVCGASGVRGAVSERSDGELDGEMRRLLW